MPLAPRGEARLHAEVEAVAAAALRLAAMVHEVVDARHVEAALLVRPHRAGVPHRLGELHRDEMDARETGLARHLARDLQQLLAAAGADVAVHVPRRPDPHHGLAVDLQVLGRVEVVLDPELRHGALVLLRVAAGRVVVRPHHRPLQVAAVLRLVERLHPVIEVLAAAVPVPVHVERADAVLHEPLDLPVHDLGVRLVVPTQHGLALGAHVPHALPRLHARPAGKVERGDVVVRLHGLRLGHVRRLREAEGGQHLHGRGERDRRHALRPDGERHGELARRGNLELGDEERGLEFFDVAQVGERGGVREAHAGRQRADRERHVPRRAGADVLDRHAHGHRPAHAVEGVLRARGLHHEVGREVGLVLHERGGHRLRGVHDEVRPGDGPVPVGIRGEVKVDPVAASVAGVAELPLADAVAGRRRPGEHARPGLGSLHVDEQSAEFVGGNRDRLRRGGDGDPRDVEHPVLRGVGREVEAELADALVALPERPHAVFVPLAVADPVEVGGLFLRGPLPGRHPKELAPARHVPLRAEHDLLAGVGGDVERPAVDVRVRPAAHDVQRAVLHGRGGDLVPALRPCGERLGRFPFNRFRPRQQDGGQNPEYKAIFHACYFTKRRAVRQCAQRRAPRGCGGRRRGPCAACRSRSGGRSRAWPPCPPWGASSSPRSSRGCATSRGPRP